MSAIRPATYHEWLLLVKRNKLRLGPLEGIGEALCNHALHRLNGRVSYGFWDHQAGSGFLDMEHGDARLAQETMRKIEPAPPVSDNDPDWK